ncbi:MAG: glycosyltransferase [Acidobacteriota bacterium]
MNTAVSFVIPTWNGLSLLQTFLPSVIEAARFYIAETKSNVEILVVDDGGQDATIDWLSEQKKNTHDVEINFVRNETNLGFSLTCNKGVAQARHRLIFLLNNDVKVDLDAIAPLVEHFTDDSVFAVHCRTYELESGRECGVGKIGDFKRGFIRVHQSYSVVNPQNENSVVELKGEIHAAAPSKFNYSMFAGGGAAMFDRHKFLSLGGFEHLLSPFYWEDVELSYRAWKRGFIILYEPDSKVYHRISSTISKLNRRKVRLIEQRNRLIYHWIHLHDPKMLLSHIAWVWLLAVTAPIRFKPGFLFATVEALKKLPEINERRRVEKQQAQRSDRKLYALFRDLQRRNDIAVF